MVNTYTSYLTVSRDIAKSLDRVEKEPIPARETEYYLAHIENVKSVDDFMKDSRLYRYAMKAFGLDDMAYAKAFMRKALEGGVSESDSFANKLSDPRYKEFVTTFNFAEFGETATVFDDARQGTVDRYMRQTLEEDAGSQNEGVRLALYFERKAPEIESWYDVLADTALSKVVRTAFGLPDSFATVDIDKQVATFEKKFDLEDFKDAKEVSKFTKRFAAMWDVSSGAAAQSVSMAALFQPQGYGISTDLMLTMQQLKF